MSSPAVEVRHWTRQEYESMVAAGIFHPEERLELIGGEILRMTPQGSEHATAIRLAEEQLRTAFGLGFDVRVQMPLALAPDSEPEPDLAVVVGAPRDYREAHPQSAVLIVEVSDATLPFDRERKARLYASAGIADYWIVNLIDRSVEVYRDAEPRSAQGPHYRTHFVAHPPATVSPLASPTVSIAISDLLP